MSIEKLVEHFSALEDPRCAGKVDHRLIDILVIVVCAVIACAESWDDIALYGRNKVGWLRSFLTLANGIPSHDTFRRVFMLIDPDAFEACFSAWVQSFAEAFDREVVAIDGKTVRRSFDRGRTQGPLHLVSAWASEQGLVLGQREVDGKSNEITAIPELLETLSLKNCIVTLDAMGCQKAIADRILERGADYLLVLKANHSKAFLAVKECCERHCFARGATAKPVFDAFDDSHGRLVRRRVFVCPEAAALKALDTWSGLRTVLAVETIRGINGSGKVEAEIRYFLSSCRDDPTVLVQAIRRHWTIEKVQAWRLSRLTVGRTEGCWSDDGRHDGGPSLTPRAAMVAASAWTSLQGREAVSTTRLRRRPLRTQPYKVASGTPSFTDSSGMVHSSGARSTLGTRRWRAVASGSAA
jgi:predicted transposase YbfD/YdcC